MSDFLQGVMDFWTVAVFRRELRAPRRSRAYDAGYWAGSFSLFFTVLGVACLIGALADRFI